MYISGVTPTQGVAGVTITITGTLFSDTDADNKVMVGDVACVITDATTTALECTLGNNPAGDTTIGVYVSPHGYAMPLDASNAEAAAPAFTVNIVLTSINPTTGQ